MRQNASGNAKLIHRNPSGFFLFPAGSASFRASFPRSFPVSAGNAFLSEAASGAKENAGFPAVPFHQLI